MDYIVNLFYFFQNKKFLYFKVFYDIFGLKIERVVGFELKVNKDIGILNISFIFLWKNVRFIGKKKYFILQLILFLDIFI